MKPKEFTVSLYDKSFAFQAQLCEDQIEKLFCCVFERTNRIAPQRSQSDSKT